MHKMFSLYLQEKSYHQVDLHCFTVDLAGRRENIATAIKEAEASQGPVYMLVNCAGFARAQVFEDIPQSLVKVSTASYFSYTEVLF